MNILNDVFTIVIGLLAAMFFFVMELFVIPGFGVMGILGILLVGITVYTAYRNLGPDAAFYTILAGLVVGGLFLYYFIKKNLFKRATLQYRLKRENGFAIRHFLLEEFMNKEGIAVTNLRPIGIVKIDEERLDAIAEGTAFVKKGSRVKAVGIEGNKIVVEVIEEHG